MVLSASAAMIHAGLEEGPSLYKTLTAKAKTSYLGVFTNRPRRPYAPAGEGRSQSRGGVWSKKLLGMSDLLKQDFKAAMLPIYQHTLAVEAAPGNPYPWEGHYGAPVGIANTGNGNLLTTLNLFSAKTIGGGSLKLALYHNSETSYSDELGNGWTWTYDIYINQLTGSPIVHWGNGLAVPYSVSAGTYLAPAGIYDHLVKNPDTTWTLTTKFGEKYNFDTSGFLSTIVDRAGNVTTFTKNAGHYITGITTPDGRTVTITLNANSQWSTLTDPAGNVFSFTYDGNNNLIMVTRPSIPGDGATDSFTYNGTGQILSQTDRDGNISYITYNTDDSVATLKNALGDVTSVAYGSNSTTFTDPLSGKTTDNYSSGVLSSEVDPNGFSVSYTARDANLNPTTTIDKNGNTWTYAYDGLGNNTSQTDPLGHVTSATYNGFSELTQATDGLGHVTSVTFDANGNLLTVKNPLGNTVETNTWNANGTLATTENASGNTTSYGYDGAGNMTSVTDPLSNITKLAYDSFGDVTSVTDALNNTTGIAYDLWQRPIKTTNPDGTTTETAYDGDGNVTTTTDELNHQTTYTYNGVGSQLTTTDANSAVTTNTYDANDRLATVTTGNNQTRTYGYDARGDATSLTLADGSEEKWSYDGNGNTTGYTNPLSQTNSYSYDKAGNRTGVTYPTGPGVSFTYDASSRITQMVDGTGTTSWGYDAASDVTSLNTPQGNMSYAYDNDGRRTSLTDGAGSFAYTYNGASEMTGVTNPESQATTLGYDADGRLTSTTFSNGTVESTTYDSRGRTVAQETKTSSNGILYNESDVYDGAGNLSSKTVNSNVTSYGYDADNQITSETGPNYSEGFTYDGNHNRLTQTLNGVVNTYHYGAADVLNSISVNGSAVKSFGYDGAGRTTSIATNSGTTTLGYDYENRVTSLSTTGGVNDTFSYNGLDTRVGKVDANGSHSFRRDGASVTDPVLNDGTSEYTPGISQTASGTTTWDSSDRMGSNVLQTNSSQSQASAVQYDAFGNLVSNSGAQAGPFGFNGQYGYQTDSDTNLQLLGHRYYDPTTGRFLTRDPAKDGTNWYDYCSNNPNGWEDASGLWPGWLKKVLHVAGKVGKLFLDDVATVVAALVALLGAGFTAFCAALIAVGLTIRDLAGWAASFYVGETKAEKIRELSNYIDELHKEGKLTDEQWYNLKRQLPSDFGLANSVVQIIGKSMSGTYGNPGFGGS